MSKKKVKVVIHERTIASWRNTEVLSHMNIVSELKRAGIPIAGFAIHMGVTNGELTIKRDTDLNDEIEYHYTWIGDHYATPQPLLHFSPPRPSADEDDEL